MPRHDCKAALKLRNIDDHLDMMMYYIAHRMIEVSNVM